MTTKSNGLSLLKLLVNVNNQYYQSSDLKTDGFHITVKSSNRNLVNSINTWNHDSQYLYNNINTMPLNIVFDSYDQLLSNDWSTTNKHENEDTINDQGYHQLKERKLIIILLILKIVTAFLLIPVLGEFQIRI